MLTKIASRNTDRIRRLALQLAVQLPEDVNEARATIEALQLSLEGFLIRAPREIWNKPAEAFQPPGLALHRRALGWTLLVALVAGILGAAWTFAMESTFGSGFALAIGLCAIALTFGSLYGLIYAPLAVVVHSFLAGPFAFTRPSDDELVRTAGLMLLAVVLPWLANNAARLRGAALNSGPGPHPSPAAAPVAAVSPPD